MRRQPDFAEEVATWGRELQALGARMVRAAALQRGVGGAERTRAVPEKLRLVMRIVGGRFGVGERQMRSERRDRPIVQARQACMAVARNELKMAWGQIGRCFGRDASTVHHAQQVARDLCETDAQFRGDYEWCVGEVEHQLRMKNAK